MHGDEYVPVLHLACEKVGKFDHLLVSFCALAIGQATGTEIPPTGKIIFGDGKRIKTVQIIDLLQKTRQIIEAIANDCRTETPRQVALNKHCPVCDFQARCRDVAINREDLSSTHSNDGERTGKMHRERHHHNHAAFLWLSSSATKAREEDRVTSRSSAQA